jgi:hypothetical protein
MAGKRAVDKTRKGRRPTRPELPATARNFPQGFYSRFTPIVWTNADRYWKNAVGKSSRFFGEGKNIHRATDKKEMRFELAVDG